MNKLYMEDVSNISLEAMEVIEKRLKEFNIVLTDKQDDAIYIPLHDMIEKLSNGDYRREM